MNSFFIPGPAGRLEALLTTPETPLPVAVALICHPHPLQQGTMHNKVVTTLAKAFDMCHMITLRFNFRGVGQSEGTFDHGVGESEDLRAVVAWAKSHFPKMPIALGGFSFGAYIALRVAPTLEQALCLVSISPPVHYEGFLNLRPQALPWLLIQGDQDDVVSCQEVIAWWHDRPTLHPNQQLQILPGVGHFFHGRLIELRTLIIDWLSGIITALASENDDG